jgi:hypothetical protein
MAIGVSGSIALAYARISAMVGWRRVSILALALVAMSRDAGVGAFRSENLIEIGPAATQIIVEVTPSVVEAARTQGKRVLLVLEHVTLPDSVPPVLNVFAGLPADTRVASTDDPRFLGTISNVLSDRGNSGPRVMQGGVVDATEAVRRLPSPASELHIDVVPAAGSAPITVAKAMLVVR